MYPFSSKTKRVTGDRTFKTNDTSHVPGVTLLASDDTAVVPLFHDTNHFCGCGRFMGYPPYRGMCQTNACIRAYMGISIVFVAGLEGCPCTPFCPKRTGASKHTYKQTNKHACNIANKVLEGYPCTPIRLKTNVFPASKHTYKQMNTQTTHASEHTYARVRNTCPKRVPVRAYTYIQNSRIRARTRVPFLVQNAFPVRKYKY